MKRRGSFSIVSFFLVLTFLFTQVLPAGALPVLSKRDLLAPVPKTSDTADDPDAVPNPGANGESFEANFAGQAVDRLAARVNANEITVTAALEELSGWLRDTQEAAWTQFIARLQDIDLRAAAIGQLPANVTISPELLAQIRAGGQDQQGESQEAGLVRIIDRATSTMEAYLLSDTDETEDPTVQRRNGGMIARVNRIKDPLRRQVREGAITTLPQLRSAVQGQLSTQRRALAERENEQRVDDTLGVQSDSSLDMDMILEGQIDVLEDMLALIDRASAPGAGQVAQGESQESVRHVAMGKAYREGDITIPTYLIERMFRMSDVRADLLTMSDEERARFLQMALEYLMDAKARGERISITIMAGGAASRMQKGDEMPEFLTRAQLADPKRFGDSSQGADTMPEAKALLPVAEIGGEWYDFLQMHLINVKRMNDLCEQIGLGRPFVAKILDAPMYHEDFQQAIAALQEEGKLDARDEILLFPVKLGQRIAATVSDVEANKSAFVDETDYQEMLRLVTRIPGLTSPEAVQAQRGRFDTQEEFDRAMELVTRHPGIGNEEELQARRLLFDTQGGFVVQTDFDHAVAFAQAHQGEALTMPVPEGHGEYFHAQLIPLAEYGGRTMLEVCQDLNMRIDFVRNLDNMAILDEDLLVELGALLDNNAAVLFEVSRRPQGPGGVGGGLTITQEGDTFQMEDDIYKASTAFYAGRYDRKADEDANNADHTNPTPINNASMMSLYELFYQAYGEELAEALRIGDPQEKAQRLEEIAQKGRERFGLVPTFKVVRDETGRLVGTIIFETRAWDIQKAAQDRVIAVGTPSTVDIQEGRLTDPGKERFVPLKVKGDYSDPFLRAGQEQVARKAITGELADVAQVGTVVAELAEGVRGRITPAAGESQEQVAAYNAFTDAAVEGLVGMVGAERDQDLQVPGEDHLLVRVAVESLTSENAAMLQALQEKDNVSVVLFSMSADEAAVTAAYTENRLSMPVLPEGFVPSRLNTVTIMSEAGDRITPQQLQQLGLMGIDVANSIMSVTGPVDTDEAGLLRALFIGVQGLAVARVRAQAQNDADPRVREMASLAAVRINESMARLGVSAAFEGADMLALISGNINALADVINKMLAFRPAQPLYPGNAIEIFRQAREAIEQSA